MDRWGWFDVDRRAGKQGRHQITPRRSTLRPVPETASEETAPQVSSLETGSENERTSGSATGRTSLANKELQPELDRHEKNNLGSVTQAQAVGAAEPETATITPEPAETTKAPAARQQRKARVLPTPGVRLLADIAAETGDRRYHLQGLALTDQGAVVSGLLASGWSPQDIRRVIVRPWPTPIRTSPAAIIAGRLREAVMSPAPGDIPALLPRRDIDHQDHDQRGGWSDTSHSSTAAADRTTDEALTRRVMHECPGPDDGEFCGTPVRDSDRCPACAGWDRCGCGIRHVRPGRTQCDTCEAAAERYRHNEAAYRAATVQAAPVDPEEPQGDPDPEIQAVILASLTSAHTAWASRPPVPSASPADPTPCTDHGRYGASDAESLVGDLYADAHPGQTWHAATGAA